MGQDWTQLFRDAQVEEYILIGETDDGSCGDNLASWGNLDFLNNSHPPNDGSSISISSKSSRIRLIYVQDDYQRWDMDALAPFQFSRFDCAVSKSGKTVSFRWSKWRSGGGSSGGGGAIYGSLSHYGEG